MHISWDTLSACYGCCATIPFWYGYVFLYHTRSKYWCWVAYVCMYVCMYVSVKLILICSNDCLEFVRTKPDFLRFIVNWPFCEISIRLQNRRCLVRLWSSDHMRCILITWTTREHLRHLITNQSLSKYQEIHIHLSKCGYTRAVCNWPF